MEYPNYNPQSDHLPLSDDELVDLDETLANLPTNEAMNIEAMDGFLTGLVLSPVPLSSLPGKSWLPLVWGGDSESEAKPHHPFASGKQRKKVMLLLLRHVHSIACQLQHLPDAWEPIFSVAEEDGQDWVDAEDWCTGFMLALDLSPDAWAPRFEDPTLAGALAPIALLGGDDSQHPPEALAQLADPKQLDALSRSVTDSVMQLRAAAL